MAKNHPDMTAQMPLGRLGRPEDVANTALFLASDEGAYLTGSTLDCSSIEFKVRAQTLSGDGVPGNADITDQDFALVISNAATTAGPPVMGVSASGLSNGCDSDNFLDRRETADLTLDLTNVGCSSGFGVNATVSVDSAPAGAVVNIDDAAAPICHALLGVKIGNLFHPAKLQRMIAAPREPRLEERSDILGGHSESGFHRFRGRRVDRVRGRHPGRRQLQPGGPERSRRRG